MTTISWLLPNRLNVPELVRCCHELANMPFAEALDVEYQKALPSVTTNPQDLLCDCAGEGRSELAWKLTDEEQEALVAMLAKIPTLKTLLVAFNGQDGGGFLMLQGLINRILLAAPQIVELQLSARSDVPLAPLQVDFLRLGRVPAIQKVEVQLDQSWNQAMPSLCAALRRCEQVAFVASGSLQSTRQVDDHPFLSYPEMCGALVQPGSVVENLSVHTVFLWDNSDLLDHLASAMTCTECSLGTLRLQVDSEVEESSFAAFCQALETSVTVEDMVLEFDDDPSDFHLISCLVPAISLNRSLKRLRLRCIDTPSFYAALALSLRLNTTLELLQLIHSSAINDRFASLLVRSWPRDTLSSALKCLKLQCTGITDAGVKELSSLPLLELDVRVNPVSAEFLVPMLLELRHELPTMCISTMGAHAARQLVATAGLESIIVYTEKNTHQESRDLLLADYPSPSTKKVPGCIVSIQDGDTIVRLLASHPQLKRIWFVGCSSNLDLSAELFNLVSMHVTFNRKIPLRINQMILRGLSMHPIDWLTALSAIANERLDWIYYLVTKWRMEGTNRHVFRNSLTKKRRRLQQNT